MCNYCEPKGWSRMCCNFCGYGTPIFISVSIAVPHGGDFPYSSTNMCEKCFQRLGIQTAMEHNAQCREDLCEISV